MQSVEALLPARLICSAERTGKEAGARRESEEQNWKLHSMNGLDEADSHSKGSPLFCYIGEGGELSGGYCCNKSSLSEQLNGHPSTFFSISL